ncbi:MAG: polyprenyl synthetase family protein [Nitrosarchaeum sp.]|nr:polyprenyl synthetase family protein [Nitrosarchaeum sp.]
MKTKIIEKNARIVNKYLNAKLKGNPKILYDAAGHLIIHGGKRLRPHMVIKSCQILGGNTTNAMPAASAVEMIHNFTLVHDDIMDNDEMRHGVPTVHKKFGMPIAILAGDVLFSKAYQTISDSKLSNAATIQLVSRLAKACVDVCEGQLLDVKMAEEKRIPSQKEYITMIGKKTAALFDVSCSMGAICATSNQKDISNLSNFGRNLGIAFQITDDLIGVMGDPKITKKPVGNDLREGKKSLPILMAIKSAKGKDKKIILKSFGNPKSTKNDLKNAVGVIRSLGIEESVRKQALEYAEKAKESLSKYSGSAKTELIDLLDFVVKRSL